MAFFKIRKKKDILDLSESKAPVLKKTQSSTTVSSEKESTPFLSFPFFNNPQPVESEVPEQSEDSQEKRKRLAKRLVDMTSKIEDLDNKIYHLQQRIELLEKKEGLTGFESFKNFDF